MAACALGSEKYDKRSIEGLVFVARECLVNGFWPLNVREEAIKAVTMLLILSTCTLHFYKTK